MENGMNQITLPDGKTRTGLRALGIGNVRIAFKALCITDGLNGRFTGFTNG